MTTRRGVPAGGFRPEPPGSSHQRLKVDRADHRGAAPALAIIAVLTLGFPVELTVLGGVQHSRDQAGNFSELRQQLAEGIEPVAPATSALVWVVQWSAAPVAAAVGTVWMRYWTVLWQAWIDYRRAGAGDARPDPARRSRGLDAERHPDRRPPPISTVFVGPGSRGVFEHQHDHALWLRLNAPRHVRDVVIHRYSPETESE